MRHHAVPTFPVLLALAAACAGSRTPLPADQSQNTLRVAGGSAGGTLQLNTVTAPTGLVDAVGVPADSVWRLMPAVYSALGVDFNTVDQTRRVIGHNALQVRRKLGDVPLSHYVACGGDASQPNANSYAVTLRIHTQVAPTSADSTRVTTVIQATARSLLFTAPEVSCASTQQLEDRIARLVREKAGGS